MSSPVCRNGVLVARTSSRVTLNHGGQRDHQLMSGCQILDAGMHPPALHVHLEENREVAVCCGSGIQLEGWGFLLSEADLPLDSGRLHKAGHTVVA